MNERIIQEISDGGKQKLYDLAAVIKDTPGLKTRDLADRFNLSERTMARHLKILQALGVVQYQGAPKTGGYGLTTILLMISISNMHCTTEEIKLSTQDRIATKEIP